MSKKTSPLNLIYVYSPQSTDSTCDASYRILYFFSELGAVSEDLLSEVYQEVFQKELILAPAGPFEDVEQIKKYALAVARRLDVDVVYLLSVYDYNQGLENVGHAQDFKRIFAEFGQKLVNEQSHSEKSGFLGRIFLQ